MISSLHRFAFRRSRSSVRGAIDPESPLLVSGIFSAEILEPAQNDLKSTRKDSWYPIGNACKFSGKEFPKIKTLTWIRYPRL
jgi:hypothetical protein